MSKSQAILPDTTMRSLPLDLIRGFAILGMIFMNIMVFVPDINAIAWHDSIFGKTTQEGVIYKIIYVLFNGKMRALFALLFGAGIIIFFRSNADLTINKSDHFSRRMLWLLLFGLIHAYFLLWPGSILFEYAVSGLLLFTLRGLNAKILMTLSFFVLGFYIYLNSKDYRELHEVYKGYEKALQMEKANQAVPDELIKKKETFEHYLENYLPLSETKKEEFETDKQAKTALFTSGLIPVYKQNIGIANEALSFGVYLNILESIGTILLGMALFKVGFFEFKLKKNIYFLFILPGIPLGMFLYFLLYKWQGHTKNELLEIYSWKSFSSFAVEGSARIILSLGYCSLLVCSCQLKLLKPILIVIGNVGRMAFSNYIAQTIICVIFFYGLKYYGIFNMTGLAIVSVCVNLFQLIASYFCIRYFNSGPVEYLWRRLAKINL
jgi:uncharacterized protein